MHRRSATKELTVLVVDENDEVRTIIRELLEMEGFTVLEASKAVAAIRIADTYPGGADVILTEVRLPDMAGTELAGRLFLAHQKLRLMLMTTGVENNHHIEEIGIPVLFKPFSGKALLLAISRAFGSE